MEWPSTSGGIGTPASSRNVGASCTPHSTWHQRQRAARLLVQGCSLAHVDIAADIRVHRAPRDSWPPHVERDADIKVVVVLLALPDAEEPKVVPTASKRSSQERHKRAVVDAACRGLIAAVKDVCAALFRQRDCKVKKAQQGEGGRGPHKCSSRGRCSPARPPQRPPDRPPTAKCAIDR